MFSFTLAVLKSICHSFSSCSCPFLCFFLIIALLRFLEFSQTKCVCVCVYLVVFSSSKSHYTCPNDALRSYHSIHCSSTSNAIFFLFQNCTKRCISLALDLFSLWKLVCILLLIHDFRYLFFCISKQPRFFIPECWKAKSLCRATSTHRPKTIRLLLYFGTRTMRLHRFTRWTLEKVRFRMLIVFNDIKSFAYIITISDRFSKVSMKLDYTTKKTNQLIFFLHFLYLFFSEIKTLPLFAVFIFSDTWSNVTLEKSFKLNSILVTTLTFDVFAESLLWSLQHSDLGFFLY